MSETSPRRTPVLFRGRIYNCSVSPLRGAISIAKILQTWTGACVQGRTSALGLKMHKVFRFLKAL